MAGSHDYDEQATFLAQFLWSPEFSPKTVAETFKTQLPVIAKVTAGYDGCDGMHEFAMDEVYCIVDIKKQKRVVMTDINDRFISIPFDYHVKFHTVGSNNRPEGAARSLSEICPSDSSSLNVNLRVMFEENQAVRLNEGADLGSKIQLGVIEYDEVYKERYLVCHPLQNNEILADVVLIPIYVPISLSLAQSFVDGTPESFSGWMRCIAASVKAFDTTNIQACAEIVVFEESPASDYTYINPLNLFQHSLKAAQKDPEDLKRYMNITQCREKQKGRLSVFGAQLPPLLDQGPAPNNKTGNQPPKQTASPAPPLPPRNYIKESSPEKSNSKVSPSPGKTPGSSTGRIVSPASSSATSKVRQEIKVAETTPPPSPSKSSSSITNPAKRPQPLIPTNEPVASVTPLKGNATRIVKNVEGPAKEGSKTKAPVTSPKKSAPSKPLEDYRSTEGIQGNYKSGLSQDKLIKDSPQQNNVCADLIEYETLEEAVIPPKSLDDKTPKTSSASGWKSLDDKTPKTSSASGLKSLDDKVVKPSGCASWKCIDSVPANLNIQLLSVDELCHCLELLEMGSFADQFRQKMVDGCLLMDLPNESLREDFGMSLFEATKLMKFAREGWRPKTQ